MCQDIVDTSLFPRVEQLAGVDEHRISVNLSAHNGVPVGPGPTKMD